MSRFYKDYETFLITPSLQAPPIVCAASAWDDQPPRLVHANPTMNDVGPYQYEGPGDDPMARALLEALLDPDAIIVAYHAPFEIVCTMAYRPSWTTLLFNKLREGKVHCPLIREKQIRKARGDRREGYGLDDLCSHYKVPFTPDKSFGGRVRYGTLFNTPMSQWPQEYVDYAVGDICVRELDIEQRRKSRPEEYVDHAVQVMSAVSLLLTTCTGFETDLEAAKLLYAQTIEKLEEYKQIVLRAGLARWEKKKGEMVVVKNKKVAEGRIVEAYAKMGREPPRGEPTEKMLEAAAAAGIAEEDVCGNIKLDEEACELSGSDELFAYSKFGQAGTLLKKVRRPMIAAEMGHRIQCRYNVLVATGRTSCSQGDDPDPGEAWMAIGLQMQNLPRVGAEHEADST